MCCVISRHAYLVLELFTYGRFQSHCMTQTRSIMLREGESGEEGERRYKSGEETYSRWGIRRALTIQLYFTLQYSSITNIRLRGHEFRKPIKTNFHSCWKNRSWLVGLLSGEGWTWILLCDSFLGFFVTNGVIMFHSVWVATWLVLNNSDAFHICIEIVSRILRWQPWFEGMFVF